MKGPISQDRMEQALGYLESTDVLCASLRADMARSELKAKRIRAAIFKLSEGSVAQRDAVADTAPETAEAWEQHFKAYEEFHGMNNRRSTEAIVFEAWRSLNSNRRQGG